MLRDVAKHILEIQGESKNPCLQSTSQKSLAVITMRAQSEKPTKMTNKTP